MKKVLALILSMALVLSVVVLPAATAVFAEEEQTALSFSDAITVLADDINPRAIRTKVLSDGTVAAVYYRSGSGIYYAESKDGGVSFSDGVRIIANATDSELAATEIAEGETASTQVALAKDYVATYGKYGRGRLEAQNPNLIELKDGNIAAFYRYNTFETAPDTKPWSIYYASICYQILDKETGVWGDVQVMYSCTEEDVVADSGSAYGVWEPDPVYIGDELFCYFADTDLPGNTAYQHLMYCVLDEETGKFSEPAIAQNGIEHRSRDGMSVVTKLNDGTYAMVFESTRTANNDYDDINNYTTFVIKMSFSTDGRNWSDPVIVAKPNPLTTPATASSEYAVCAAPYVVTLPDGRLAVSYQTTDRYTGRIPNRVSYRIGTQVAISSEAITSATFANNEIDDDVTSYFATEVNPGILAENEFSKSAELMVRDNKLYVYYSVGQNSWITEDGVETEKHDFGAVRMAYMQLPEEVESKDYTNLDNYIVYQADKAGTAPTDENGVITIASPGTTNLVAGTGTVENVVNDVEVEGLFTEENYTGYNDTHKGRFSFNEGTSTVMVASVAKAYYNKDTALTTYKVSSVLESFYKKSGSRNGYMQSGYIIHAATGDDFKAAAFNSSGYVIFLRRTTENINKLELCMRYCNGATAVTFQSATLTTKLDTTKADYKFRLDVEVTEDNAIINVYDVTDGSATKLGSTYTWALDYTSVKANAPVYSTGAFAFVTNGATTFSDFTLTQPVTTKVDTTVFEKAQNLNANAVFNLADTVPGGNLYAGFNFHTQDAAAVTAGLSAYTVKLIQTPEDLLKLEFSVYELNEDKSKCTNLKSYAVDITEAVIGAGGTTASAKIILDVTVIGDTVTATVTNSSNSALTHTQEYDLNNYYSFAEYGKGGYGIYKHGTGTISVEDVEFTVLPLDVNNIDNALYTTYVPEGSEGIVYEDGKFVSKDAVAKKMILKDTEVSDFSANATLEIGYDGQLKAGIIFRAQNIGNDTDAMEGYSAVLWKNENGTGNFGRVLLLVYKWGKNAAGETVYLGEVGRIDDRNALNAVYPKGEKDMLAAVGAHLKINIKVDGDVVRASFDVLNEYNEVAASSDTKSFLLNKEFAAENINTYYESGAIGLSISSAGAICDFNITENVMGKEMSVMSDYTVYSNNDYTMTIDSSVNKKMYSTTKGRKQAVLKGTPLTNFEASAILKSNTAGEVYNMGFDFMINEETHSGYAYNTNHATMGYEGYRVVLVRETNDKPNPAKAILYLFEFTKDDSGYTRKQIKAVGNDDFFSDYTTADTTDKEYANVEVELAIKLVDGNLTAVATMCEYPERTITLTTEGLEGSGSVGWFISDEGSVSQVSVNSIVTEGDLDADGNVNSNDLAIMRKAILGMEKVGLVIGDVSVKDREIDIRDIVKLKKLAAGIE